MPANEADSPLLSSPPSFLSTGGSEGSPGIPRGGSSMAKLPLALWNMGGRYLHKTLCRICFLSFGDVLLLAGFAAWMTTEFLHIVNKSNDDAAGPDGFPFWSSFTFYVGDLAQISLSLLLLPLTKRFSPLLLLLNVSYERAVMFHRWLARFCFAVVMIHGPGMIYYEADLSVGSQDLYGFIAFLCIMILFVTTMPWVRRHLYELFSKIHAMLFPLIYIMAFLHYKPMSLLTWLIVPGAFYVIDWLMRILTMRHGSITSIKEVSKGVVEVSVRLSREMQFSEPAQFTYLWIPAAAIFQYHPFSVAAVSMDGTEVYYYIRALGPYTRSLLSLSGVAGTSRPQTALIDGPYGSLSIPIQQYTDVLLICGGIGITPMLSCLLWLLRNNTIQTAGRIRSVRLAWGIRKHDIPLLQTLAERWIVPELKRSGSGMRFEVVADVYVSDSRTPDDGELKSVASSLSVEEEGQADSDNSGGRRRSAFQLHHGRLLPGAYMYHACLSKPASHLRIGVLCCGPDSLNKSVLCAVHEMEEEMSEKKLGSIDVHFETFAV